MCLSSPMMVALLIGKPTGEWVRVQQLCLQAGLPADAIKADLVAAWLKDPAGDENYAIIIFYDEESMGSMAARYNRQRLLNSILAATERAADPVSKSL